jgi:hypothetical protein
MDNVINEEYFNFFKERFDYSMIKLNHKIFEENLEVLKAFIRFVNSLNKEAKVFVYDCIGSDTQSYTLRYGRNTRDDVRFCNINLYSDGKSTVTYDKSSFWIDWTTIKCNNKEELMNALLKVMKYKKFISLIKLNAEKELIGDLNKG